MVPAQYDIMALLVRLSEEAAYIENVQRTLCNITKLQEETVYVDKDSDEFRFNNVTKQYNRYLGRHKGWGEFSYSQKDMDINAVKVEK